ncbi:MAG TPA: glycosyltransferase [Candidatus Polarisedimenticolia bacterium]|nr:glycosyltransferase [Candidatus Polarisedimenticolia bacterium]
MTAYLDTTAWIHLALAAAVFFGARMTPRWPGVKWGVVILSVYLSLRYFLWRYVETLNTSTVAGAIISIGLVLAETYGFVAALLFYFQTLSPREDPPPPVGDDFMPTVDVLVTIYNESPDILYRTLVACQALDYPAKKVYVCDDGQLDTIREMTEKLGCSYIRGPRNADAKSGNLNHALTRTDGELILTMDVDHIPVRSFLRETVGFFRDPRVALVQTAHHFYNPDIFQRNLRVEQAASNEQDMFFHVVQPGRNQWNSSFYCGSGAVLRRGALAKVGGFRTETVTEDIHTSIRLHGHGYRSVYVNKDLAAGLAPEDFVSYLRQRKRWARGCFQIFLKDNPLWARGLKLGQRINYFASIFYFLHGWPRLMYLIAPLAYLLFRQYPLRATIPDLISFWLPNLCAFMSVLPAVTRVFRKAFWADIYETVMCLPLALTSLGVLFRPGDRSFAVTPKGLRFTRNRIHMGMIWWLLTLAGLTVAGLWIGSYRLVNGPGAESSALIINLSWALYNFFIIVSAILTAYERPQLRGTPRLARRIPCEVTVGGGAPIQTHTRDLSETGLSLELREIYSLDPEVGLVLKGDGEVTRLRGEIARFDRRGARRSPSVGVRFSEVSETQRQSLVRQMYSSPALWAGAHSRTEAGALMSLGRIATSALRARAALQRMKRRSLRMDLAEKCRVRIDGREYEGELHDVSVEGLAVEMSDVIPDAIGEATVLLDGQRGGLEVPCRAVYSRGSARGVKLGLRVLDRAALSRWMAAKR